jgi:hypothetical protein
LLVSYYTELHFAVAEDFLERDAAAEIEVVGVRRDYCDTACGEGGYYHSDFGADDFVFPSVGAVEDAVGVVVGTVAVAEEDAVTGYHAHPMAVDVVIPGMSVAVVFVVTFVKMLAVMLVAAVLVGAVLVAMPSVAVGAVGAHHHIASVMLVAAGTVVVAGHSESVA